MTGWSDSSVRFIVPTERHVERFGLAGAAAETKNALLRRLLETFASEVRWASPEVTRLALTESLRASLYDDPLMGPLVRGGGGAYLRTVELVDAAMGELRRAATPLALLERVEHAGGGAGLRASTLRRAVVALDRTLEAHGLIDARSQGRVLADVLRRASSEAVADAARGLELIARFIVSWDASDLLWWRVLAQKLDVLGGRASIELPQFEKELSFDADRERDPLETVFDDLLAKLDDAPSPVPIAPVLGDFIGSVTMVDAARVAVVAAHDAVAQARAAVHAVIATMAGGAPADRIAVALPRIDEDVLVPLRTAFEEAGIPFHEPRGAPPTASAIVATALDAHGLAARKLPRLDVAMLLRSRYVDPTKLTGEDDRAEAKRVLREIADALENAPTSVASDDARTLEETIVAGAKDGEKLRPVARRVAELLASVEAARTRSGQVRSARALWEGLGFPARVSLDARSTLASDVVPEGLARAELTALASDAHGWRVLNDALDAYAGAVTALGIGSSAATTETFRHELDRALEAGAPPPGAGRIGAVRIARMTELAGEPLSHLLVVDANEGVLPSAESSGPLFTEAFTARLRTLDASSSPASATLIRSRELTSLALAAARSEHVTLFHRETGRDGEALAAAPLALWLTRAGASLRRAGGGMLVDAPLSEREELLQTLALAAASRDPSLRAIDPEATRRASVERAREMHHGSVRASASDGERVRPRSVEVGDLVLDRELAALLREEVGEKPLPITSLERFARCAFQGYVHQILGARDVRVANETPDAREAGTIVHEALAAALRAAAHLLAVRPVDADAVRALGMEAADRVLRRGTDSTLRVLALELARERVLRVIDWTLKDAEWVFSLAEQSFGDPAHDAAWPELLIREGDESVLLRGGIDRVDVSRARSTDGRNRPLGVRVIDYKSSASTVREAKRELGNTMLQVPLYALAAKNAEGADYAEGLYVPVAELDPNFGQDAALAKKWQEILADEGKVLRHRVLEVVGRVRSGALAPTPEHESYCDSCSFDGVCRRPRFVANEDEAFGGSEEGGG